jgi:hypothetical protein
MAYGSDGGAAANALAVEVARRAAMAANATKRQSDNGIVKSGSNGNAIVNNNGDSDGGDGNADMVARQRAIETDIAEKDEREVRCDSSYCIGFLTSVRASILMPF